MNRSPITDSGRLSSRRGQALLTAAIVGVTLAVYLPVLNGGFIWDDSPEVWNNPLIKAPDGLRRFWLTTQAPDYFPLTSSTLWVEWRLWNGRPAGFHVVNVLLHAAGAVLLWRVLRRLAVPGAWLAGMLFAVHPVAAASAAWIAERKNTLSMALSLLSLLAYFVYEEGGKRRWYAVAVLTFLLALLAKTCVVMLPVVLLLCAWWRRGAIGRRDLLRSAPFFALSLALGLVTIWFQNTKAIGDVVVHPEGAASRAAAAGWVAWFYLCKLLLPVGLCVLYPRWKVNGSSVVAFVPLLLLLGGMAFLWTRRKSWGRAPLFALGCFLVALLPILGFLDMSFMRFSLVADHLQYPAMAGVVAFAAAILARAAGAPGRSRLTGVVAAVVCVAVLGALTCRRAWVYADEDRLWQDNAEKNPKAWAAWYNLGNARVAKDLRAAIEDYTEAIRLKPDYTIAYRNRAATYYYMKEYDKAAADVETLQKLGGQADPDFLKELARARGLAK